MRDRITGFLRSVVEALAGTDPVPVIHPNPWDDSLPGDIGDVHRIGYEAGNTALEWAEEIITTSMATARMVEADRFSDPAAWPGYWPELTDEGLARSILSNLLDAGWTVPTIPATTQETP